MAENNTTPRCPVCNGIKFYVEQKGVHIGLYCYACEQQGTTKWISWVGKKALEGYKQRGLILNKPARAAQPQNAPTAPKAPNGATSHSPSLMQPTYASGSRIPASRVVKTLGVIAEPQGNIADAAPSYAAFGVTENANDELPFTAPLPEGISSEMEMAPLPEGVADDGFAAPLPASNNEIFGDEGGDYHLNAIPTIPSEEEEEGYNCPACSEGAVYNSSSAKTLVTVDKERQGIVLLAVADRREVLFIPTNNCPYCGGALRG